jgi:hypothetical protein
MATVYVLGAGASRHAGYPLTNTFGEEMITWLKHRSDCRELLNSVETLIECLGPIDNVEKFLSALVETIASDRTDRFVRAILASGRSSFEIALRYWFNHIRLVPAVAYQNFVGKILLPGDVIISFNYDVSLEKEMTVSGLFQPSSGYGFHFGRGRPNSKVKMLKLHGSTNWVALILGGARGPTCLISPESLGVQPIIPRDEIEFLGSDDFDIDVERCAYAHAMVLPIREKQFSFNTSFGTEWQDFWDSLWAQAANALQNAQRVVIAGYSLPLSDTRARTLLFSNIPKSALIEVVSASDSNRIANTFSDHGFRNTHALQKYFQDWVETHEITNRVNNA